MHLRLGPESNKVVTLANYSRATQPGLALQLGDRALDAAHIGIGYLSAPASAQSEASRFEDRHRGE